MFGEMYYVNPWNSTVQLQANISVISFPNGFLGSYPHSLPDTLDEEYVPVSNLAYFLTNKNKKHSR